MMPARTLPTAHNFSVLARQWRQWARRKGYLVRVFAEHDGFPLLFLEPRRASVDRSWWYFSAGIHGDEPAGPWGLLRWAENESAFWSAHPALIFPCLNPWGLVNNTRTDARGCDMNRAYANLQGPCAAQARLLRGRSFRAACCLHEDYDAAGIYLYELREKNHAYGEKILREMAGCLPRDPRKRIEGRVFRAGLLSRAARRDRLPAEPEAVFLRLHHTRFSFTFETPSEADFEQRVRTQVRFLEVVTRVLASDAPPSEASSPG